MALAALLALGCPPPPDPVEPPPSIRTFWVDDLPDTDPAVDDTATYYPWAELDAKLAHYNDRCAVYIRNEDVGAISQAQLEHYGNYFADHSWPDVTGYVYKPTEFFGEPAKRINIFFYSNDDGIAGYFWSKDFYTQASIDADGLGDDYKSNETNVFYLHIEAAEDQLFTEGTLTHEFQHMCNAHYFHFGSGENKEREMDSWANELCSTTMESIFADQYAIYIPTFNSDPDGNDDMLDDYANGQTDFLYWDNSFTQYSTASLLGGYILSQIDAGKRPDFVKTFLDRTFAEDPTPAEYNTDTIILDDFRSSIEDLIATLQDDTVNFDASAAGAGWQQVADFDTGTADITTDWNIVMKGFLQALAGENAVYQDYLDSVTDGTYTVTLAAPTATAGATSIPLRMSAFIIGKTKVTDLDSTLISAASSSGNDAYVYVWNGAIPSYSTLGSDTNEMTSGTAGFDAGDLLARTAAELPEPSILSRSLLGRDFNRSMSRPLDDGIAFRRIPASGSGRVIDLPGAGDGANPSDGATGFLYCAYTARP